MDERINISLKGSGRTTRIILKAMKIISFNKDKHFQLIIVVNTNNEEKYIRTNLLRCLGDDYVDIIKDKVIFIPISQKHSNHNFFDWYDELEELCKKYYELCKQYYIVETTEEKNIELFDFKILIDIDIPLAIKKIVSNRYITKYIELIEVPLECIIDSF